MCVYISSRSNSHRKASFATSFISYELLMKAFELISQFSYDIRSLFSNCASDMFRDFMKFNLSSYRIVYRHYGTSTQTHAVVFIEIDFSEKQVNEMKFLSWNLNGPPFNPAFTHSLLKNLSKMFLHFSISLLWAVSWRKRHQKQLKRMSILSFQKVLSCEKSSSFFHVPYKSNPLLFRRPRLASSQQTYDCVMLEFVFLSLLFVFTFVENFIQLTDEKKSSRKRKRRGNSFLTFSLSYFFLYIRRTWKHLLLPSFHFRFHLSGALNDVDGGQKHFSAN